MTTVIRGSDNFDTAHGVPTDVTALRALNTTYTTGPRARLCFVSAAGGTGSDTYIEGQLLAPTRSQGITRTNEIDSTGNWRALTTCLTLWVPPNTQFRVLSSGATPTLARWIEVEMK